MIKYKLTTQALTTYKGFQWEVGKTVTTSGEGGLCSAGWLHYYHSPELAVLLNPIHAAIRNARLWEVEADGRHLDDRGLKGGCTQMCLLRELPLPVFDMEQRVEFAIRCAMLGYTEPIWQSWAEGWLRGDRGYAATAAAKNTPLYFAPIIAALNKGGSNA